MADDRGELVVLERGDHVGAVGGWRSISANSSPLSRPSLRRRAIGVWTLPTSCTAPAARIFATSLRESPIRLAIVAACRATRRECRGVGVPRLQAGREPVEQADELVRAELVARDRLGAPRVQAEQVGCRAQAALVAPALDPAPDHEVAEEHLGGVVALLPQRLPAHEARNDSAIPDHHAAQPDSTSRTSAATAPRAAARCHEERGEGDERQVAAERSGAAGSQ
jgi:hypothetical protein